jgi:hypothetical protein
MIKTSVMTNLPARVRDQVDAWLEVADVVSEMKDPRVLRSLGPASLRGLILHRGKQGTPTKMQASHQAHFDWTYPSDQPAMKDLYRRAKAGQWDGEKDLPWSISVDPENPEVPLLPDDFVDWSLLERHGVRLDA